MHRMGFDNYIQASNISVLPSRMPLNGIALTRKTFSKFARYNEVPLSACRAPSSGRARPFRQRENNPQRLCPRRKHKFTSSAKAFEFWVIIEQDEDLDIDVMCSSAPSSELASAVPTTAPTKRRNRSSSGAIPIVVREAVSTSKPKRGVRFSPTVLEICLPEAPQVWEGDDAHKTKALTTYYH